MSPLLFALQTDFDTIWLNCTEEQNWTSACIIVSRSAWLGWVGQDVM